MANKQKKKKLTPGVIIKILELHKEEIYKFGVKRIGLFGSFLKGTQHRKSDLDFLVVFNKPGFDNYMELKFMLERLFNKKIDLVTERSIKPALRYIKDETLYAKV